jgi:hypothetical protein
MNVRVLSTDEASGTIGLLVRVETALYAVKEALKLNLYDDDKAVLTGVKDDLASIAKAARDELGL